MDRLPGDGLDQVALVKPGDGRRDCRARRPSPAARWRERGRPPGASGWRRPPAQPRLQAATRCAVSGAKNSSQPVRAALTSAAPIVQPGRQLRRRVRGRSRPRDRPAAPLGRSSVTRTARPSSGSLARSINPARASRLRRTLVVPEVRPAADTSCFWVSVRSGCLGQRRQHEVALQGESVGAEHLFELCLEVTADADRGSPPRSVVKLMLLCS